MGPRGLLLSSEEQASTEFPVRPGTPSYASQALGPKPSCLNSLGDLMSPQVFPFPGASVQGPPGRIHSIRCPDPPVPWWLPRAQAWLWALRSFSMCGETGLGLGAVTILGPRMTLPS